MIAAAINPTPISELFGGPRQSPTPPVPSNTNGVGGLVLVAVLVVILTGLLWSRFGNDQPAPTPDGDKHEQVEPVPTKAEGYLFFIYERQTPSIEDTATYDLGAAYVAKHPGLEIRGIDQNDPAKPVADLINFAKQKGVEPPCVVFKNREKTLVNAIKWPKTDSELAKVLKK